MVKTLVEVDVNAPPQQQPKTVLHNRWHPDVPPIASVEVSEVFRVECLDWTGGQIKDNDDANDVKYFDGSQIHYLSGPFDVKGAEPGDLLVVEILDVAPLPGHEWGYTGLFAKENGGGFLTEHYPFATKAIWKFEGLYASSRHIPGVRFIGNSHPGIIGCAPSAELLAEWNEREKKLVATNPTRVPPLAFLPEPNNCLLGTMDKASNGFKKGALEAARTIPGREHGGNCDIKNLGKGSKVYLPVYVKGAKLSVGDLHFSQGDGEITFCGAIEMAGSITLKINSIIKDGMNKCGAKQAFFLPGTVEPRFTKYLTFEGISVDESGKQLYLDAHVAYRRACLNAIEYMKKLGYSGEQAYVILGTSPMEGRISGIVDVPNACCTVAIPTEIFEFDILPGPDGVKKMVEGGKIPVVRG